VAALRGALGEVEKFRRNAAKGEETAYFAKRTNLQGGGRKLNVPKTD
jgi:hypothetical protein